MHSASSFVRLLVQPVAVAIVLAVALGTVVHIYTIPSTSMVPTLQVGDHILVSAYLRSAPERGDVIVFRSLRGDELLVKRIVAVPGDLIESRFGRIAIGGHALSEGYLAEPAASGSIPAQIVPSGCYFVMGDNRGNSIDSRHWGVLPGSLIVGRARLVLWSSDDASSRPAAHAATPERGFATPATTGFRFFRVIR